jgi:hypothetical protein
VPLLRRISPVLSTFEADCSKATTACEVTALYQRHGAAMRNLAVAASTDAAEPVDSDFVERLNGGFSDEPLMRVMYRIETQMGSYDGRRGTRTAPGVASQPQHIRVPAAADAFVDNIIFWFRFFSAFAQPTASIMVLAPTGQPWVDVVLGEPEETEFFCLRAGPKALPQASEVPYTLDDEFRTHARAALQQLIRGGAGDGDDGGTVRWLKSKLFNR